MSTVIVQGVAMSTRAAEAVQKTGTDVQDDVLRLIEGLTFDELIEERLDGVEHGDSERADAWREYRDALCTYTWDALRGGHK